MKVKRTITIMLSVLMMLITAYLARASPGNGNMEGGGSGMGEGFGESWWNPGNDGVRITVVDAYTGEVYASPQDFTNISLPLIYHFGKVSKISYRSDATLKLRTGSDYTYRRPSRAIPTIVNASGGSNIAAIKQYFCSEYAVQMVADAVGMNYNTLISGSYKLLIEPIAYFTFRGASFCMTATEAALYDQLVDGKLWYDLNALTHKNLPLSIFLEYSDLGFPAWSGSYTSSVSNASIISSLGLGIVNFAEQKVEVDEPADYEYRVDTDVITSITLRSNSDLTPSNSASVTFYIGGKSYQVNNVVMPAGDSQVVWVKWHTPKTPQMVQIRAEVTKGSASQTFITARVADSSENSPPDPKATDTNRSFAVPVVPNKAQKTSASWGVWSCYWFPPTEPDEDDEDGEVIPGYWAYRYHWYSASLSASMTLSPDDAVPTAREKNMKIGYGVKISATGSVATSAPSSHYSKAQTAVSTFPEFRYQTYSRLLEKVGNSFVFAENEYSTYNRRVHFTPVWYPDERYTVFTQVMDAWTPVGMLSLNVTDYVTISGNLYDDWYSARE